MKIVTTPHNDYCEHCPSQPGMPSDPESEDIASWPDGVRQGQVFPCAWRPNKLCKGVCDQLGYEEEKHAELVRKQYV